MIRKVHDSDCQRIILCNSPLPKGFLHYGCCHLRAAGGPLEDLTGPALNNFIKFVAVVSFVTSEPW